MKRDLMERKCFPGKCVTYPEKLVSEITSSSDSVQSLINCAHSEEYSPNTQAKRFSRARKLAKTSLSSSPMLFKVVSYFCV